MTRTYEKVGQSRITHSRQQVGDVAAIEDDMRHWPLRRAHMAMFCTGGANWPFSMIREVLWLAFRSASFNVAVCRRPLVCIPSIRTICLICFAHPASVNQTFPYLVAERSGQSRGEYLAGMSARSRFRVSPFAAQLPFPASRSELQRLHLFNL